MLSPGVQCDDGTINEWHTCPEGRAYQCFQPLFRNTMFLDNTACNLASINLAHFFDPKTRVFDVKGFEHTCRVWTIVLEISVLMAQFPSKEVAQLSRMIIPYASVFRIMPTLGSSLYNVKRYTVRQQKSARHWRHAYYRYNAPGTAYATSAEIGPQAEARSNATKENKNHMLRVMHNIIVTAAYSIRPKTTRAQEIKNLPELTRGQCPDYLLSAACNAWDKSG